MIRDNCQVVDPWYNLVFSFVLYSMFVYNQTPEQRKYQIIVSAKVKIC